MSPFPFMLRPAVVPHPRLNPSGQVTAPVDPTQVVPPQPSLSTAVADLWRPTPFTYLLSTAGMAMAAYHGYKRNDSVGWALAWGFLGAAFPIITNVIALAEGYAQPARPRLRSSRA